MKYVNKLAERGAQFQLNGTTLQCGPPGEREMSIFITATPPHHPPSTD